MTLPEILATSWLAFFAFTIAWIMVWLPAGGKKTVRETGIETAIALVLIVVAVVGMSLSFWAAQILIESLMARLM